MTAPDGLKVALEALLDVRGVVSVAVAGADGSLVEGLALGQAELEALQELVPTALASSSALGALVGDRPVEQSLVEYAEGPVLLTPLGAGEAPGGGHVLVIGLDSVSDLGRVRFQIKRQLAGLAEAVAGR